MLPSPGARRRGPDGLDAPRGLGSRPDAGGAAHAEPALGARHATLRRAAGVYIAAVVAIAAFAISAVWLGRSPAWNGWPTFAALAVAAAVAQTFPVKSPRNLLYHTSVVFLVAAALLVPPELLVLIPIAQTLPEWARTRRPLPQHAFDAANYVLNALAAWGAAQLVERHGGTIVHDPQARFAAAGIVASVCFVAVNHLLVAGVIRAGRERTLRDSGLFSLESVSVDLVLTLLGVSVAAFWRMDAWLVFTALAPLVVVHRSLSVPQLQAEARVDPKTGLYNARYFSAALAAELARASRFERPMAVIMADLDLLRDVNNSYGHLAGDAVLRGIAGVFRAELRNYDVPARFGGEEFSILLPETGAEQALEIAERIRRAVAEAEFEVATAPEPLRATLSMGVAAFPHDGLDANELIHQADLAVYRAKLQGRNRVLGATSEPLLLGPSRPPAAVTRLHAVEAPAAAEDHAVAEEPDPARAEMPAHELVRLRFASVPGRLALLAAAVAGAGALAGAAGFVLGGAGSAVGLLAVVALAAGGQALSFELAEVAGSISVGSIGSLAAVALFGYRAALPVAAALALVEWVNRRTTPRHMTYTLGSLSLAGLAAAGVLDAGGAVAGTGSVAHAGAGVLAGAAYFAVSLGLLGLASALETGERVRDVLKTRCSWLLPHYLVYGFIGSVIAVAYDAAGIYAVAVFALPLLLIRKTHAAYVQHTQRSAHKLREAAQNIRAQNLSLERANGLLRERSTAAMESLSATVDARDAYTAGHSRRVQQLALAIGRELGLGPAELDLLDRAALFHDIGKLAVPDAILLKPAELTPEEWRIMQAHAEEGARIIERLGFLQDAVPAIRHHHERWDGAGYPDRLAGDEIPLGARIIHVADALDSMLTTRIYRAARPLEDALGEIRGAAGSQFCPRCVNALERLLPIGASLEELPALTAVS